MSRSLLRPLSLGEVLDVAFGLYRTLFAPLLVVTVVTQAVPTALGVYIESAGGMLLHLPLYLLTLLLSIVLGSVATAASVFIISENYLGRSIEPAEALRRATPFVGRLVLVSLGMSLAIGIGLVLMVVPGLILLSGLAVATPALVIEDLQNGIDPLGRSWNLTRRHRWKMFWALLTVVVLIVIPSIGLGTIAALVGGANVGGSVILMVAAAGLQLLLFPMFYCVLTVAYYDLRVRKEGFDLELLAAGMSSA